MLSPLFSIFTQGHLPDIQGGISFKETLKSFEDEIENTNVAAATGNQDVYDVIEQMKNIQVSVSDTSNVILARLMLCQALWQMLQVTFLRRQRNKQPVQTKYILRANG